MSVPQCCRHTHGSNSVIHSICMIRPAYGQYWGTVYVDAFLIVRDRISLLATFHCLKALYCTVDTRPNAAWLLSCVPVQVDHSPHPAGLNDCIKSRPPMRYDLTGPTPCTYTPRRTRSNASCVISPKSNKKVGEHTTQWWRVLSIDWTAALHARGQCSVTLPPYLPLPPPPPFCHSRTRCEQ